MVTLLWILAVILASAGIFAVVRGQLLWVVVLIVVGLLVGPGGVSIFAGPSPGPSGARGAPPPGSAVAERRVQRREGIGEGAELVGAGHERGQDVGVDVVPRQVAGHLAAGQQQE